MQVSESEWGKGKIWERRELLEKVERIKWDDLLQIRIMRAHAAQ